MFFKMLNHQDVVPTEAAFDCPQAATNFQQPSPAIDNPSFVCTSQTEIQALQGSVRLCHSLDPSPILASRFLNILESVYPMAAAVVYQFQGEKWNPLAQMGNGEPAFAGFVQDWDWRDEIQSEKQGVAAIGDQAVFMFIPLQSNQLNSGMLLLEYDMMSEEQTLHQLGFLFEMGANFTVALLASNAFRAVNDLSEEIATLEPLLPFASVIDVSGGIAHDINNPLQIILGKIQVDKLRHQETPLHNELENQAMRIATLSRGLMQLARPQQLSNNMIDIKAELNSVLTVLQRQLQKSDSEVSQNFSGSIPLLKGNGQWVRQLLLTMLLTARRQQNHNQQLIFEGGLSDNAMIIALRFSRELPSGKEQPYAGVEAPSPAAANLEERTIRYLAKCLDGEAFYQYDSKKEGIIKVRIPVGGRESR